MEWHGLDKRSWSCLKSKKQRARKQNKWFGPIKREGSERKGLINKSPHEFF